MTYKAQDFINAIENSGGFITTIAKRVGCSRSTVYDAIRKYSTVARAIDDEKEQLKDLTENELLKQIRVGNTTAIIFYLKTQAKERGYTERYEHTGRDGGGIEQKLILDFSQMNDEELKRVINTLKE